MAQFVKVGSRIFNTNIISHLHRNMEKNTFTFSKTQTEWQKYKVYHNKNEFYSDITVPFDDGLMAWCQLGGIDDIEHEKSKLLDEYVDKEKKRQKYLVSEQYRKDEEEWSRLGYWQCNKKIF